MDPNEVLLSVTDDRYMKCADEYVITHGSFLDVFQQSDVLKRYSKVKDCNFFLYGGHSDCERKLPVFVPKHLETDCEEDLYNYFLENPDDDPVSCIHIKKDKFSSMTHRDYLGALMGLGIKRETIGDIDVSENGAYIFTLKKIAPFICDNLISVGRGSVRAVVTEKSDYKPVKAKIEEKTSTVSSLRLDNIVSLCYNLSRTKATEAVNSGLVFVNGVEDCKPDRKVGEGDKIVFRSKGKVVVKEIAGLTKKQRTVVVVDIYK